MGPETTVTKRKRATGDPAATTSRKKVTRATPKKAATAEALGNEVETAKPLIAASESPNCPLLRTLSEYGLLKSIVASLYPSDLLSLALTSKATYNTMMPNLKSLDNLLSIMPCSGLGIHIRQRIHKKSQYFYDYNCTEIAQCGSSPGHRLNIESRPCVSCKVTTCNECRIHCVYQSIYDAPTDADDLPNFSGFVLLNPLEVAVLSPLHLPWYFDGSPQAYHSWRDPATAGPHHDQGFLEMPLEANQAGTPERIDDVLDVDLGQLSLATWSASSQFSFPSPVLHSLCDVAMRRKLFLCEHCFHDASKGYRAIVPALPEMQWLIRDFDSRAKSLQGCHCSLRNHILDRWQCVRCYETEASIVSTVHDMAPTSERQECRCGLDVEKTVCMWCWGEIKEGKKEYESVYAE